MSNKITIESIDAVYQRIPNATYSEAKEALQACDGDVVEAIILLESKKSSSATSKVKKTVKGIFIMILLFFSTITLITLLFLRSSFN